MNRRNCVIAALCHQESEPIPYDVGLTNQARENLIAYTGDSKITNKIDGFIRKIDFNGWPTAMPDKPEHFQDAFGVVWNRSGADKDIGVIENPLISDLEDNDYCFPEPDIARMRREIETMLSAREDKFTIIGFGFCMFERSWSLMGMENVLMNMILCPDELEYFYDRICDYMLRLVDVALEYDVDGIYFGDDWGQQKGLIMGIDHWRRFIKPRMARLYARVKEQKKFIIQHSCGDCHEIFPDLIEIGLDCYQTFQPEIYDIVTMKALYGSKITFWGGVSTQRALPFMTPQQVQEETVRIIKTLRKDGGLIIGPTHAIPFDVPPENILAMVEVFQNQGNFL